MIRVTPHARRREDRAGDPLDGLVNLFDLGIVLSVAFLLAALTSLKLGPDVLGKRQTAAQLRRAPADAVLVSPGEHVKQVTIQPGQRVVGRGKPIGTVYELSDGRTVVVRSPQSP